MVKNPLRKVEIRAAGHDAGDAVGDIGAHGGRSGGAQKLTELLYETRLQRRHEIATLLAEFAAQARRRADRVENTHEVLGPLATLLEYQYGPAKQAAATKEAAQEDGKELETGP